MYHCLVCYVNVEHLKIPSMVPLLCLEGFINGCIFNLVSEEDGCCNVRISIGVIHCGDYFVYALRQIPPIDDGKQPYGYCTGQLECNIWVAISRSVKGENVHPMFICPIPLPPPLGNIHPF